MSGEEFVESSGVSARLTAVSERFGLSGSSYNRIVQAIIYTVAFLIPLWYLPFTSGVLEYNKQLLLVLGASTGLIVWLLGAVVSGKLSVRTTPIDKGVFAVLVATVLAAIFSVARAKSIFGLSFSSGSSMMTILALSALYFLAVNTIQDRGRMLRLVLASSIAVALLLGILQMFTWYFLPGGFTHSRAFNTVGSLNVLGVLAAVCLPLFAKIGQYQKSRGRSLLGVVGVALSLVVLGILNWWVLWVIALAGMMAVIGFDSLNASQLRGRLALARFAVPITVVVLGAFLMLVRFNPGSLKSNFPTEVSPSYGLSWHITTKVVSQRLLFGWGPENFSLAFDRFGASRLSDSQYISLRLYDAASELFNTAIQQGVVGLVAMLFLLWCVIQSVVMFSTSVLGSSGKSDGAAFSVESSGVMASMIALVVATIVYPFNTVLMFGWYAFLIMAALTVAGGRQRTVDIEERPMWALSASLGFIVGLIVVLSAVYFLAVRYLADFQYARALEAKTADASAEKLTNALNLDPGSDRYLRDASQVALLLLRDEAAKGAKADGQKVQNYVGSAVQFAQRATDAGPGESLNWVNLAQIYGAMVGLGLVDNVERLADSAYQRASELRPGDPTFDNENGQMWLGRAELVRSLKQQSSNAARLEKEADDSLVNAEKAFQRAIEKSSSYGLAIYNLGAVYERQNNVQQAIKQLEKIAPFNANNPTLMLELGLLYVRVDRKDEALAAFQRAVLLAPQYANARWYLALLLEERGEFREALTQLRAIEKDNQSNETFLSKIRQLEAGAKANPPIDVIDNLPL